MVWAHQPDGLCCQTGLHDTALETCGADCALRAPQGSTCLYSLALRKFHTSAGVPALSLAGQDLLEEPLSVSNIGSVQPRSALILSVCLSTVLRRPASSVMPHGHQPGHALRAQSCWCVAHGIFFA